MPELCKILDISINDLFSGEMVDMKNNEKILEEHLLEMTKLKEEKDRQFLHMEVVIGIISVILFITIIAMASLIKMDDWVRFLLIGIDFITFLSICFLSLKIEQIVGYYECSKCHHKYVPTYFNLNKAMHMGRTRYLKCPKFGKRSWQKKVIK